MAASPQEEISAQHAEWFGRVIRAARPVCALGDLMRLTTGIWRKAREKPVPTKGEEKTPERPAPNSLEPSKNGKGHKVPIRGYKGSSILNMGHFQDHGPGHSPKK